MADAAPSNKPATESGEQLVQLSRIQFERFREFIYANSGIRVLDTKLSLLSNRIRRRLKAGAFADFDTYYRHLTSVQGRAELQHFLDSITTNETFFFRTQSHFDWLSSEFFNHILEEQRRGVRQRSLRIWSAGCATGAEPYTIAICLHENRHRFRDWSTVVLGTDISEEALREARAGVFRARAVEAVAQPRRRRCFTATDGDRWQVRSELKRLVSFEQHNLMKPMRQAPFDCVFIRNVLIYFDRDSKRRVVANLIDAMVPGGLLVVGPSEGIYDVLDPLVRQHTFLYRKPLEVAS
jgi:chemotaxis protein methyltransferase CheR